MPILWDFGRIGGKMSYGTNPDPENLIKARFPELEHLDTVSPEQGIRFYDNARHVYALCRLKDGQRPVTDAKKLSGALEKVVRVEGEIWLEGHPRYKLIDDDTVEALDGCDTAGKAICLYIDDKTHDHAVVRVPKRSQWGGSHLGLEGAKEAVLEIVLRVEGRYEGSNDIDGNKPEAEETETPETAAKTRSA